MSVVDRDAPLSGVLGAPTARALEDGLHLRTVEDLLRHYPRRYAERGTLTPLDELEVGEHVTVHAQVERSEVRTTREGKKMLEVVVTDGASRLRLTFFGKAVWRAKELPAGRRGLFAGQVTRFRSDLQLTHPDYSFEGEDLASLVPVYPATRAVPSWNVAKAVRTVLDGLELPDDPLPEELRREHRLLPLSEALRRVHRPDDRADVARATQRLRWDEAYVVQVALAQRRAALRRVPAVPRVPRPDGLLAALDAQLPFSLTQGQRDIGQVLLTELARSTPVHRLLQGEVGSGKTLVALRAMLAVVDAGGQAALLAPTEVLAQQHARSLRQLLGPLALEGQLGAASRATRVALLTGSLGAAARRSALLDAASGAAGIVVGTHALLSEGVRFADLGLVVVDEQHRFGVEQRDALRAKGREGTTPHLLVMTATPIPRTVAMTVFGDLETSVLRELPQGRSPVATFVVGTPRALERTWQRVREEVEQGRQVFVVCPRIGDVEDGSAGGSGGREDDGGPADLDLDLDVGDDRRPPVAVLDLLPLLEGGPLAGLRLAALHGRLPPEDKEAVMGRFTAGDLDVLVATTVVEVGVDVPNATTVVVMDADRFGVSQLHQLRGRVGRGRHPGLCLLVTEVPQASPPGQRLTAVAGTTDGFALSELDLEQRREGDVLGVRQSGGTSSLRMLQVLRDADVVAAARQAATALVADDPDLERHPALAAAVRAIVGEDRAAYLEKA